MARRDRKAPLIDQADSYSLARHRCYRLGNDQTFFARGRVRKICTFFLARHEYSNFAKLRLYA